MRTKESLYRSAVATALLLATGGLQAADKQAPTDAELIASAMRAAPASIAMHATIVVPGADGSIRTLRKGTNDFTCMPDNPATPGPDPMCADKNAWAWLGAYMAHKPPPSGFSVAYMLEGGVDPSNTDPFAAKPASGQHWIRTGPHLMLFGAEAAFYDAYPKGAVPDTSAPYVMWAGTPYQHLMTPVR